MRLTLVIASLEAGGAERVLVTLANHWASQGWSIVLLSFDDGSEPPFYDLNPHIQHRPLALSSDSRSLAEGVLNNLHRLSTLRRAIQDSRPHVVLSFVDRTNVLTLLATLGLEIPIVISERTDPACHRIGRGWEALRWLAYRRCARLVTQSRAAMSYFPPSLQRRTHIIPNPVASAPARAARARSESARTLLALGRLSEEKGFDMLIRAFSSLAPTHPAWTLTIWGEGVQRKALERQCDELSLRDRIRLPGRTNAVTEVLSEADLFVMSSRYEGFPNALCEAMASGLPVVSFDCPSGPREIIRDGIDGVLVPTGDVEALARALEALMDDETRRKTLAARARDVVERFSIESVARMWDQVLQEATREGKVGQP